MKIEDVYNEYEKIKKIDNNASIEEKKNSNNDLEEIVVNYYFDYEDKYLFYDNGNVRQKFHQNSKEKLEEQTYYSEDGKETKFVRDYFDRKGSESEYLEELYDENEEVKYRKQNIQTIGDIYHDSETKRLLFEKNEEGKFLYHISYRYVSRYDGANGNSIDENSIALNSEFYDEDTGNEIPKETFKEKYPEKYEEIMENLVDYEEVSEKYTGIKEETEEKEDKDVEEEFDDTLIEKIENEELLDLLFENEKSIEEIEEIDNTENFEKTDLEKLRDEKRALELKSKELEEKITESKELLEKYEKLLGQYNTKE